MGNFHEISLKNLYKHLKVLATMGYSGFWNKLWEEYRLRWDIEHIEHKINTLDSSKGEMQSRKFDHRYPKKTFDQKAILKFLEEINE